MTTFPCDQRAPALNMRILQFFGGLGRGVGGLYAEKSQLGTVAVSNRAPAKSQPKSSLNGWKEGEIATEIAMIRIAAISILRKAAPRRFR